MFAGHDDAGSNDWARDGGSDGWPLALQQPSSQRGFSAPLLVSTPSQTSDSSSDLDTESTGSFFPERSHTLGSLIGIQMHAQSEEASKILAELPHADAEKRKSTSGGGVGASLRGRAVWCAAIWGCGGAGSNPEAIGMSPSLANLLEEERRSDAGSGPRQCSNQQEAPAVSMMIHANTLFDEQGILPPRQSGAPLKLVLEHASPSSSYLSADWNVFTSRGPCSASSRATDADARPSHGRFPTVLPALCGRLGTGLAG